MYMSIIDDHLLQLEQGIISEILAKQKTQVDILFDEFNIIKLRPLIKLIKQCHKNGKKIIVSGVGKSENISCHTF